MAKNSKHKFPITPADRDDPIFQDSPVIGGRGPGTSPAALSKRPKGRGRGLPHQYPWIDEEDFILPGESSKEDADE